MADYGKRTIMLIHERPVDSLIKDACTFIMAIAMIGVGVALGSVALQWIGAGVFMLASFAKATLTGGQNCYTVSEARQKLDEIEGAPR